MNLYVIEKSILKIEIIVHYLSLFKSYNFEIFNKNLRSQEISICYLK